MNEAQDFGSLEYRVKPVTRYVITRYEEGANGCSGGVATRGEYENADVAWEVAYALCKQEHERYGYPVGDNRIRYPEHPHRQNCFSAV